MPSELPIEPATPYASSETLDVTWLDDTIDRLATAAKTHGVMINITVSPYTSSEDDDDEKGE